MNITDLIDKASTAIENFQFADLLKGSKVVVIIFAAIAIAIIVFGFFFSLIPQF